MEHVVVLDGDVKEQKSKYKADRLVRVNFLVQAVSAHAARAAVAKALEEADLNIEVAPNTNIKVW